MDFDREYDLENAGIDAFDFSLMDEDERAEALRDAGLDPDDFDGIEFDSSFDSWSALQDSGLSLSELDMMDEDEKREALEDAGLDPDDYDTAPRYYVPSYSPPAAETTPPVKTSNSRPNDPPSIYRYCSVVFPNSSQRYSYRAVALSLEIGDIVMVPTGPENKPTAAKVVAIGDYTEEVVPYPLHKTKLVLRKATADESVPFAPKVSVTPPPTIAPQVEHSEPVKMPSRKSNAGAWVFAAVAVVIFLIVASVSSQPKPTTYRSSQSTYTPSRSTSSSYSRSYSTTPTCPPVNRERAMTKEEADRLSGTGYHGTRPNSSAEISELKAAQVRCKNCGYRSHNGLNSLCDYCAWMERYGGGLPTEKAPDVTPKPTPRPTPKPTPRPTTKPSSSDPYHASDYAHPEDFYYDYYDDFWDYEDAEDYWERYN